MHQCWPAGPPSWPKRGPHQKTKRGRGCTVAGLCRRHASETRPWASSRPPVPELGPLQGAVQSCRQWATGRWHRGHRGRGGGALPAPWTLPHPQRGVSTGHFAWRDRGWGRQAGKTHMASYQPGQGGEGKQAGPGQPLPQPQGVDAGGWVPRTQNKPAFYFQVLQWTLSKVPGEEEWAAGKVAGRGRGWTEN